jgi:aminopeptidase N
MIVIRNFSDAWLKESWATYTSALWFEDQLGRDAFDYDMYLNAQRYFRETGQYIRPIVTRTVNHTWQLFDSHLYPGGAWRIHMIRKMLGDEIFWEAVQDYVMTYVGMTVETVDFQRKFEEHTGRSLQQFFDQWVLEANGFPDLRVKFSYDITQGRGTFSIEQQQAKEEEDHVFIFDLDLAVWDGSSYQIKTVHISQKKQEFTLPLPEKPHHVRLDPEQKILFRLAFECEDELLVNQLQSPDIVGRIIAAEQLIKGGKRKHMESIAGFVRQEPFYGVRERVYRALGESNSRFAIPILVEQLKMEQDDRVLADLARYAGKYRDERILNALKTFLNRDLPPYACANALESLGLQRDEAVADLLLEYTQDEGWRGIARAGAYKGLAKLRREDDLDLFLNAVRYGNELEDIRRDVIGALADLGQWLGKKDQTKVKEALVDLLRDCDFRIRLTAARGLQTMKAKETITELRALKGLHAAQEQVAIEKIIKAIQKSSKEDEAVKSLNEKIEKFEEKIAKLDEEVQKLKQEQSKERTV